jgi:prepilin-type N-terminal cleavage/methylation domain-containing protein
MWKVCNNNPMRKRAFSLVELLVVIAVIAILATIMLPLITGHRQSGEMVVARQQQAALQTALGSWVAAQSSLGGGLAAARTSYVNSGNKLSLLQDYLQPTTYVALTGDGSKVTSRALIASGASLHFSGWGVGGSPSIVWSNSP